MARIWRGMVELARSHEYLALMRGVHSPVISPSGGNHGAGCLHRFEGDMAHFETLTISADTQASRLLVSEDFSRAKYYAFGSLFLAELKPRQHYEVFPGCLASPGSHLLSCVEMKLIDPEKERRRLAEAYAAMSEGELAKIAAVADTLSPVASEALQSELALRRSRGAPVDLPASIPVPQANPPDQFILLRRFRDMPEALLAGSVLNSAGVEYQLGDENLIRMDWLYSNLVGGIKLWVREADAETAAALLDQNISESVDPAADVKREGN